MPQEISFTLEVSPLSLQTSGKRLQVINGKPRFFKNSKATRYQNSVRALASQFRPAAPLQGPLTVDLTFILPRPQSLMRRRDPEGLIPCPKRPDRDNLQKGTQDALSDFWIDDGQIFDGRTTKFYAEKNGDPRIIVTIRRAGNE